MVVAVSVLSLTLLLISGCTGDGEAAAFERAFAGDRAIESMELTSHDNQPFTGGVSGEVRVRADTTDDEFAALVDRVADYTRENGDRMQGRVSLIVDGFEVGVTGDQATDDDAVRLLLAMRADPRAEALVVGESSVAVVGVDAAGTIELARELPMLLDDVAPSRRGTLSVRSDDRAVDLVDAANGHSAADELSAAVQLWDVLVAEVPLSGVRARQDTGIVVTLHREDDLSRAREAAARVALDGITRLAFASDLVSLGDSDGEGARLMLARLEPDVRTRIADVWISDTRIQVTVRTEADRSAMVEAIDAALPPDITEAWLVADGDAETRVTVRPSADDAGVAG